MVYSSAQEPTFRIFTIDGETIIPEIPSVDGYSFEIQHFVDTLSGKAVPSIITPEQSGDSVKIIEAEKESIRNNDKISLL